MSDTFDVNKAMGQIRSATVLTDHKQEIHMSETFNINQFMGELRSHISHNELWVWDIVKLIEGVPDHFLEEVVIPYLQGVYRNDQNPRGIPEKWVRSNWVKGDHLLWHERYDLKTHPAIVLCNHVIKDHRSGPFYKILMSQDIAPLLRYMTLGGVWLNHLDYRAIKESPYLGNVKYLKIEKDSMVSWHEFCEAAANACSLSNISHLDLSYGSRAASTLLSIENLLRTSLFNQLEYLDLSGTTLWDSDYERIKSLDLYGSLETIKLGWGSGSGNDLISFFFSDRDKKKKKSFKEIDLTRREISKTLLEEIFSSSNTSDLKRLTLNLTYSNMMSKGIDIICESERSNSLEYLGLENLGLEKDHIKMLTKTKNLKNLKHLNLRWNRYFGQDAIYALLKSDSLPSLERIDVFSCFSENKEQISGSVLIPEHRRHILNMYATSLEKKLHEAINTRF